MDMPQDIKNKFIVRSDYLDWVNKETSIFAYLDLTNMFHWQDVLGWRFRMEDAIGQFFTFPNIKEVKVYYGLNERRRLLCILYHVTAVTVAMSGLR